MAKMQEFLRLNLWDISHYWHGYNPQRTNPNSLPVDVQISLRALTFKLKDTLYFKCTLNSFSHRLFYQDHKPLRLLARDFQRKLKKCYSGRSYNKKFLQSLELGRSSLLMWCQKTNTKPPSFWFDEDDPILDKPVEDNFSSLPDDEKRKYGYFAMFDVTEKDTSQQKTKQTESGSDATNNFTDIAKEQNLNKEVKDAISKMYRNKAKAAYKKLDEHKSKYIQFFYENNYNNKSQAARDYFLLLSLEDKKIVVPTYYVIDHENGVIKAVRTLTTALREYLHQRADV